MADQSAPDHLADLRQHVAMHYTTDVRESIAWAVREIERLARGAVKTPETKAPQPDGPNAWDDVYACIEELRWYASRKKNLAEHVDGKDEIWADIFNQDLADLGDSIRNARGAAKTSGEPT